jgi:CHRD domain
MNRIAWTGSMLAAALFVLSSIPAGAQEYHAKLSGFEEVGAVGAGETGAILSPGEATVKLTLDKSAKTLKYTLTYSGLPGISQSHIHFGKEHVAGGVMVFFCTNLGNGPAATPGCTAGAGTVSGTIIASDVQAIGTQNVTAGDFAAVVAALTSNTAYANIHTANFKAGEIRGQIHPEDRDRDRGKEKDKNHDRDHDH